MTLRSLFPAFVFALACGGRTAGDTQRSGQDQFDKQRERMVAEQLAGRDIRDARVLDAMRKVPRHLFVPAPMRAGAYQDSPLAIGNDQTISQPYIVAYMTQALELKPAHKVLEI